MLIDELGAPLAHAVVLEEASEEGTKRPRRLPQDTRHLRRDQTANLLNAWGFAEQSGSWLNLHIVIHWDRLGLPAGEPILKRQGRFLNRLGKWLDRRHKPLAYVWTMEASPHKGTHTHLLLSARLRPEAVGRLVRHLPNLLDGRDADLHWSVIKVGFNRSRLPYNPHRFGRVAHTKNQRRGLIAYLLKGAEPAAACMAGINAEDQGEVRVRRCGVSRSLDWTTRQRAGWRERALGEFDLSDLGDRRRQSLKTAPESPPGRLRAA